MSLSDSDKAINRVLLAEKQAAHEVDNCRHEAEHLISNAQERVRHIINRADKRITQVHAIAERIKQHTLADIQINTQLLSEPVQLNDKKRADIDKATELLVAELIGAKHEC